MAKSSAKSSDFHVPLVLPGMNVQQTYLGFGMLCYNILQCTTMPYCILKEPKNVYASNQSGLSGDSPLLLSHTPGIVHTILSVH